MVTEWNPTFAAVTTELGIGVELCWPHAPNQKGSVENLVGWVKGSFFKQRRFWDRHDLETQLAALHQAEHPRLESGQRSVLTEHRSSAVAAVSGKRAKRYLKREHLLELGPAAHEFLTELVHRHPRLWVADVDRLHDLLQHYGEPRMLAALQAAVRQKVYGAEYVASILRGADIGEAS